MADVASTEYQLIFGGENELDATTLGVVLLNTVILTEEANKELGTGQKLEIKVQSNRQGSFIVDLTFQIRESVDALIPLVTPENIAIVKTSITSIVSLVTAALSLRKALKNETPAKIENSGDNVVIITSSGNKVTVEQKTYNFYFENPKANQAIQDTFKALDKDETVKDFSILDEDDEKLFEADREDFPLLTTSVPQSNEQERKIRRTVELNIVSLSFKSSYIWKFIFGGYPINASITDTNFLRRVEQGNERFANGDILEVELEIDQEFDRAANTYINKKFVITKVLKHIPRPTQPPLISSGDSQ